MKKSIFLFACMMLMILASCASDEAKIEIPSEGLSSNLRTASEAIAIAKNHYEGINPSRADMNVSNVVVIGSKNSRSYSNPRIYAVNFSDNDGYVLVSATKNGEAILGYTDGGTYNQEDVTENENFSYFMDAALKYVDVQSSLDPTPDPSTPTITWERVYPRLMVNYGQYYPEGELFSNGIAGCVQTACAMILSYTAYPKEFTYTCPDIDLESETIDWPELKKHVTSCGNSLKAVTEHDSSCEASKEYHKILSRICRELGYRNLAEPKGFFSTFAYPFDAQYTLEQMMPINKVTNFKSFSAPYAALFESLLNNNCVAFVSGYSDTSVHAWVCDGADEKTITSQATLSSGEVTTRIDKVYYYHYNWGNCGKDNGYFYQGVFDTENPTARTDYSDKVQYFTVVK